MRMRKVFQSKNLKKFVNFENRNKKIFMLADGKGSLVFLDKFTKSIKF